ncbi:MAG: HdeD family acid-resistance protein [Candidatus Rokuibacteriota bacterium]|nr:MAG: HdeD family acid-resistance protein [Candidatus Rokubacteria bacterium]
MDTRMEIERSSLAANWWAIALRGVAGILFGVLTFVVPGLTLAALVLLFGSYAIVDGVLNIVAALRRRRAGEPPWWALLLEGVVSVAAGVVTFAWPGLTTVVLLYVIAGWAIITGAFEMAAAVRLRQRVEGEGWLVFSGILSIALGVLLMAAPATGALALVLWIGAYAIVFGALLVVLAFRLRRWQAEERATMARAA